MAATTPAAESAVVLVAAPQGVPWPTTGRCRRRHRPGYPRRRVLLDAGPLGLRQDDGPADDRRLRDPDVGAHRARRAGRDHDPALRPRRQHGVPGLRAVPAHERPRERRVRPARQEGRPPERRARAMESLEQVRLRTSAPAGRGSSPVGSANASRWPAPSSTGPGCCSSTSPSAPSTSSSASRCRWSSRRSSGMSASPSCSSPTTRRRRLPSPTASPCSTPAASSRSARLARSTSNRRTSSWPGSSARPTS